MTICNVFSLFPVPECPNSSEIVELLEDGDGAFGISIDPNPFDSNPLDALRGTESEIVVDQEDEFIIVPDSFKSPFRVMVVQLTVTGATDVTVTFVDEDAMTDVEVKDYLCYNSLYESPVFPNNGESQANQSNIFGV